MFRTLSKCALRLVCVDVPPFYPAAKNKKKAEALNKQRQQERNIIHHTFNLETRDSTPATHYYNLASISLDRFTGFLAHFLRTKKRNKKRNLSNNIRIDGSRLSRWRLFHNSRKHSPFCAENSPLISLSEASSSYSAPPALEMNK